jgi:hypothetical protein
MATDVFKIADCLLFRHRCEKRKTASTCAFNRTCWIFNEKFIIIIIIIIIGKDTISFMQDIYTYIPETNHVPNKYNVAAIL